MAENQNLQAIIGGNQAVGKVFILYGTAKAISPDGTQRVLAPNSLIYANDRIITESDGSVSIMIDGPQPTQMDLGRMSNVLIDEDVFGEATPEDIADATAEVDKIEQALREGDEPIDIEAPAAGGPNNAGGGHPTVNFELTAEEVLPTSGAETEGFATELPDPIPGVGTEDLDGELDFTPEIGPEEGQVEEADLPNDTVSGVFDITSEDGVAALRVGGQDVTGGGTIIGTYGTLVVTESSGTYSWEYTLSDNTLDHSEQGNDTVLDTFSLEVEDTDGDTAGDTLTITVVDDVPVATDDADSVTEGLGNVADGNVFTGVGGTDGNDTDGVADDIGADDETQTAETAVTGARTGGELDDGELTEVSGTTTISGTYGDLEINPDGSYTYTLKTTSIPEEISNEIFTYEITDGDGDTDLAELVITLNQAAEGGPSIGPEAGQVEEADLPIDTTSGTLDITSDDAIVAVRVGGVDVTDGGTVIGGYGTLVITESNGTYSWEYTLSDNTLDHSVQGNDSVFDIFSLEVEDSEGDTASNTLTITVVDDVPVAVDDTTSQGEEDADIVYNVMTNTDGTSDDPGEDGASLTAASVREGLGSVSFLPNGQITYDPAEGEEGTVVIDYTITDNDGDVSDATLTIFLNGDSEPTIGPEAGQVEEADLPIDTTSGTFDITSGDALAAVRVDGQDVTGGGTIIGTYGRLVVTESNGTYNWEYTLSDNTLDHRVQGNDTVLDTFALEVEDADGDTEGDTLTITVVDDVPVAVDDTTTQGAESAGIVYNVMTNTDGTSDDPGEDGATLTAASVNTGLGRVSFLPNGQVTYNPADGEEGTVIIDYTITDNDGDTSDATLTINLVEDVDPEIGPEAGQVEEADLPNDTVGDTFDITADDGLAALRVDGQDVTNGVNTITGTYGTLVVTESGGTYSWEYTLSNNTLDHNAPGNDTVLDIFTLEVEDTDGDKESDTLTITVVDDIPVVKPEMGTEGIAVEEESVPDGIGGVIGNDETESPDLDYQVTNGDIKDNVDWGADGFGAVTNVNVGGTDYEVTGSSITVYFAADGSNMAYSAAGVSGMGTTATGMEAAELVVNADGTYRFTVLDNFNHADGAGENWMRLPDVTITAEDGDGDEVGIDLDINVQDDVPTVEVLGDTTVAEDSLTPASGTWSSDMGADDVGTETKVLVGTTEYDLDTNITLTEGTLRVNSNNTWTFDPNTNLDHTVPQGVDFTVRVTDGDGDVDTDPHSITITDGDDPEYPEQEGEFLEVDEALIVDNDDSNATFTAGSDDLTSFKFGDTSHLNTNINGVAGDDISWDRVDDTTIEGSVGGSVVITLTLTPPAGGIAAGTGGDANVEVELTGALPHPAGGGTLSVDLGYVDVVATEHDGDHIEAPVYVSVVDDVPTVEVLGDTTVAEDSLTPASGTWSSDMGADDVGTETKVLVGTTEYDLDTNITLTEGTLRVNSNNTWTFDPNTNLDHTVPQGVDFTVRVTDGDGDVDTDLHSITITDGDDPEYPEQEGEFLEVDEALIVDTDDSNATFTAGSDDLTSFKFGDTSHLNTNINGVAGDDISWDRVDDTTIEGSVGGSVVITLTLTPPAGGIAAGTGGDANVEVELTGALPHPAGGGTLSVDLGYVDVVATEHDGDHIEAPVYVSVVDDVPTVEVLGDTTVAEDSLTPASGTWSSDMGADDVGTETKVLVGTTEYDLDTNITLTEGTLRVNSNNTWTFDPNTNLDHTVPQGVDFTVRVTDGDGDVDTDLHSITITDGDDPEYPEQEGEFLEVDEALIVDTDDSNATFTAGSDDLTSFKFGDTSHLNTNINGVAGDDISWDRVDDTTIEGSVGGSVVITLTLTPPAGGIAAGTGGDANVEVELTGALPHPAGGGTLSVDLGYVDVVATEHDGDHIEAPVYVSVVDDVPTVEVLGDTSVAEDSLTPAGGTWSSDMGADLDGSETKVLVGTTEYDLDTDITLAEGTLRVNSNNTWTFDPNDSLTQPVDVTFTVRVTDGDGDVDTDTHTIEITDADGPIAPEPTNLDVFEGDLTAAPFASTDAESPSFTLGSDHLQSIVFSGSVDPVTDADYADGTISWVVSNGGHTLTGTVSTDPAASIELTLTGIDLTNGDFTVDVTMTDEFTHTAPASGSNINDFVIENIAVVGTDINGEFATAQVNVRVVDDVPTVEVLGDTSVAEDSLTPASGTWSSDMGADDVGTETKVLVGTTEYDLDTDITLAEGTLRVNSNNTWTFDPNTNLDHTVPQGVDFTVRVTDGDGDVDTDPHSITITDGDDPKYPEQEGEFLEVDEAFIVNNDDSNATFTAGSDDLTSFKFGDTSHLNTNINGVAGDDISWDRVNDTTIEGSVGGSVVITLTLTPPAGGIAAGTVGDANVEVELTGALPHPAGGGTLSVDLGYVDVVATEHDGDHIEAPIYVSVVDDVPTVEVLGDTSVAEDAVTPAGGTWLSDMGADIAGAETKVLVGTTEYDLDTDITLAEGTLRVNSNNTWTFDPNDNLTQPVDVTFTVRVTDGDGDVDTDTHTIEITDADGPIAPEPTNLDVFEGDLTAAPFESFDTASPSFTLGSDNLQSIVFSGAVDPVTDADYADGTISWVVSNGGHTLTGTVSTDPAASIELTLTGIDLTNGDFTVDVTMTDEFTHTAPASGSNINDFVIEDIAVVGTDINGNSATAQVNVSVVDDVPTVEVLGDTSVAEDAVTPAGGTWSSDMGADDVGTETKVLVGTTEYDLDTDITLAEGTLRVNSNNTWTFDPSTNLDHTVPQGVDFTVRVTDGDGDVDTDPHSITITDGDDPKYPEQEGEFLEVDEALIVNNDDSNATFTAGSDDLTSFKFGDTSHLNTNINGVAGDDISWDRVNDTTIEGYVGASRVITLTLTPPAGGITAGTGGDANVEVELTGALPHPAGGGTLSVDLGYVDVVATEHDGDHIEAPVYISVVDDVPVAYDDANSVTEGGGNSTGGNVFGSGGWYFPSPGDNADEIGADDEWAFWGTAVTGARTGTELAGGSLTPVTGWTWISGTYGDLEINEDGSYTYTLKTPSIPEDVTSETFTYEITDSDGDKDLAQLVITLDQDLRVPDVTGDEQTVFEDGLADGAQHGLGSEMAMGFFTVNANSEGYELTLKSDVREEVIERVFDTIRTSKGVLEITNITDQGARGVIYEYRYTLLDNLTHTGQGEVNPLTDTITMSVVDDTGDSNAAPGQIVISIVDDIPTVEVLGDTIVAENSLMPAGGTWISNMGADIAGAETKVLVGTTEYDLDTDITLAEGTLRVNSNNTWTFDPNDNLTQPVDVTFTVRVTDGDGDVDTDTHTIDVTDGEGPIAPEPVMLEVFEDDLTAAPFASTDAESPSFTLGSDHLQSIVFSGSVDPVTDADYADGTISWVVSNGGHTLTGTVSTDPAASIELNLTGIDLTTGDFTVDVTMTDEFTHEAPLSGSDNNDFVIENIAVVGTDRDGQFATAHVNVRVVDDVPTVEVLGDTSVAEDAVTPASGTWSSDMGADLDGSETKVLVGTTEYDLDSTINLTEGTLQVKSDYTWTFDPNTNLDHTVPQGVDFTVRVTDGDGDVDTDPHSITITDGDDPKYPEQEGEFLEVDEALIVNNDDSNATFTAGSDDLTSFKFGDTSHLNTNINGVAGDDISWDRVNDTTIEGSVGGSVVITLTLTPPAGGIAAGTGGDANVEVELTGALPHPAGGGTLSVDLGYVDVVATEHDGDHIEAPIYVSVVDDVPTVEVLGDTNVAEDAVTPAGGTWLSDMGADIAGSETKVLVGASEYDLDSTINLTEGTLQVKSDYTWTFNPNDNLTQPVDVTFTVRVTDGDGDVDTDTHTIEITDGEGPIAPEPVTLDVFEDDLTAAPFASTDAESPSFTLGSDNLQSIVFSGSVDPVTDADYADGTITWVLSNGDHTLTGTVSTDPAASIELNLTGIDLTTGDFTVDVTMTDEFTHTAPASGSNINDFVIENIAIVGTDTNGDAATAHVNVRVVDDVPTVEVLGDTSVVEGSTTPASGTWSSDMGADLDGSETKVLVGTTEYDLGSTINLTEGTLQVKSDYTWTFDPNDNLTQPEDITFTVRVTDGDGDVDTDVHTIDITDGEGPIAPEPVTLEVFEDDLTAAPFASTDAESPSFTLGSDNLQSIVFSGAVDPVTDADYADGAITWVLSNGDHTLTGTVSTDPAASIELNLTGIDLTTGDFTVDVTMTDEFTHTAPGSGSDINDFVIENIAIVGTDPDGQYATAHVNVRVVDDIPVIGDFMAGTIPNEIGTVNGFFDITPGADGIDSFDITGPTLTGVTYSSTTTTVGGFTSTTLMASSGADDLFSLTVREDGTYTFNLIKPETETTEEISLAQLGPGGPGFRELEDDPNTTLIDETGRIEFTSNGTGVNANANAFGVSNSFVDPGEWFMMEFHNPGEVGDDPADSNPEFLSAVTIDIVDLNNGDATIRWEAVNTSSGETESGAFIVNNTGDYLIDPSIEFNQMTVANYSLQTNPGRFSVSTVKIFKKIIPSDEHLDFDITATDGDGDVTSTGHLGVHIVAESDSSFTLTGTNDDDAIATSSLTDTISGGDGHDIVDYSDDTAGVHVDLLTNSGTGGTAEGDTYNSIEGIIGGTGNDTLTGNDSANDIHGNAGNDTLDGGLGDDTLTGGTGADTFKVGEGHDTITDYNRTEGDDIDAGNIGAATWDVIDHGANSELVFYDGGGIEIDSVTFEDTSSTELLNSLLGTGGDDDPLT